MQVFVRPWLIVVIIIFQNYTTEALGLRTGTAFSSPVPALGMFLTQNIHELSRTEAYRRVNMKSMCQYMLLYIPNVRSI